MSEEELSLSQRRDELRDRVRSIIRDEQLEAGERLDSERGLAEHLGVSRTLLRSVLEDLERDGEIRRSMGRAGGIFVSDGKIERNLNTIIGVPDILRQQGFQVRTVVLHAELALPTVGERRQLRLDGDDMVLRVLRRRDADGVSLSLEHLTLPTRRTPGIHRRDLSEGIYRILSEDYGIELSHADESIDVALADLEQAQLLDVAAGLPLFALNRTTYSVDGSPIERARDFFRADRLRITMHRAGARWKRAPGG